MMMMKELWVKIIVSTFVFLIPFSIYIYTLSPTVAPGDSTEMVTAAVVLGVPHQPSYPLIILLGHLASKLPVPLSTVARVNAVSSLLQALTVLALYLLVVELFKYIKEGKKLTWGYYLVAMSSSMFLAFSLVFWQYATKFEVFGLNNLFAVLILLVAVKIGLTKKADKGDKDLEIRDMKGSAAGFERKRGFDKRLLGLALLVGLAFSHHQTIIIVFPTVFFLLFREMMALLSNLKGWVLSLASFVVGMVPFFGLIVWIASRKPDINWGEVTGIEGAMAALVRKDFGTFSSYLIGFGPDVRPAPVEQVTYFVKNMVFDFSIVGVVLVLVGVWYAWKHQKRLFWFITIGFLTGMAFLMYANFPFADSFNEATLRRFHMLPSIFVTLYLAMGMFFIFDKINKVRSRKLEYKLGVGMGKVYLIIAFLFSVFINFSKANHKDNDLTLRYLTQAYQDTPKDALIMLSGDIPNMTMDYFRMVEGDEGDRRITFTPGQFHLDWFKIQLRREYPDLYVPKPYEGKLYTSTTQVVDANYGRWPIYVGPDLVVHDPELEKKYALYPKNMLFLVKKKGEDLKLEEWREENDRLWEGLDIEQMKLVKKNSPMFEETVVFYYLRHFFNVGFVYEEVKLYEDAIREYERVLEIDPFFKDALASLGRIYGEKLEEPDYLKGIDYMQKYRSVLERGDEELDLAAQGKMYEYQQEAMKEAESFDDAQDESFDDTSSSSADRQDKETLKMQELTGQEATPSAGEEE